MGDQLVKNLLPSLLLVDPNARLSLLRSEEHAEEKNRRMMAILNQQLWWMEYQSKLEERRQLGRGPWPEYPNELVEGVETYVDRVMRGRYGAYVR